MSTYDVRRRARPQARDRGMAARARLVQPPARAVRGAAGRRRPIARARRAPGARRGARRRGARALRAHAARGPRLRAPACCRCLRRRSRRARTRRRSPRGRSRAGCAISYSRACARAASASSSCSPSELARLDRGIPLTDRSRADPADARRALLQPPAVPRAPRRRRSSPAPTTARARSPRSRSWLCARATSASVTEKRIAAHAGISGEELPRVFASSDACLLALLEELRRESLATVRAAAGEAAAWPAAVHRAVRALLAHLDARRGADAGRLRRRPRRSARRCSSRWRARSKSCRLHSPRAPRLPRTAPDDRRRGGRAARSGRLACGELARGLARPAGACGPAHVRRARALPRPTRRRRGDPARPVPHRGLSPELRRAPAESAIVGRDDRRLSQARPRRVGHKGAAHIEPGNTLASFDAALRPRRGHDRARRAQRALRRQRAAARRARLRGHALAAPARARGRARAPRRASASRASSSTST